MSQWFLRTLKENKSFIVFIVLMSVFRSAVADWNDVPTGSMKPTIVEGDRILIDKLAYDVRIPFTHVSLKKLTDPKFGDIIIFDSKVSDKRLVKRVVGEPGDVVSMTNNKLFINNEPLHYEITSNNETTIDYIESRGTLAHKVRVKTAPSKYASFDAVKVPVDHYLVLGDNRDNSADSRFIGFVPRAEIIGKSEEVVMSLNYDNYYLPRADRFLQAL